MAKIINFPVLTKQEMMALAEVVFVKTLELGPIASLVDVRTGAESGDRIAWVGRMGMVGKKGRGCSPTPDTPTAPLTEKKVDLKEFDIRLVQCYTELEGILYRLGLKKAAEIGDLEGTDWQRFYEELLTEAIDMMYRRMLYFGDTEAENVTDGGEIKDGVDVTFFTTVDGVFKQIADLITAGAAVVVKTITSNAQATKAAQLAYDEDLLPILDALILDAPAALAKETDSAVYVTRWAMSRLKKELLAKEAYTESQFKLNEEGFTTVMRLGREIIEMPDWDEVIEAALNNGTKYFKPFRMLYTTKSNVKLCVPGDGAFTDIASWYENKERSFYTDVIDKLDVLVMRPELIAIAW